MKIRFFPLVICAALLLALISAAAAAGEDSGFYAIGEAGGVEISPVSVSGDAVSGVVRDADGDGEEDVFYPGAEALLVTLWDTAEGELYILTLSSSERTFYADQRTGGGELRFRAAFPLPDCPAELRLEIGSTEAGFAKISLPLFYTPSAPPESGADPAPEQSPEPEGIPGYAACGRDGGCPLGAFTDLDPAAWYHDGVHYVLENGIMNGVGSGQFSPSGHASRGMIVTVLWRMEGMPEAESAGFRDVAADAWYAKAISWAAAEHIVEGYSPESFGPDDPISREQLAVILWRYAGCKGTDRLGAEDVPLGVFIDAEQISPWAFDGVQWAVNAGLISGTGEERLSPKTDAGRAQVAAMLMRYSRLG